MTFTENVIYFCFTHCHCNQKIKFQILEAEHIKQAQFIFPKITALIALSSVSSQVVSYNEECVMN